LNFELPAQDLEQQIISLCKKYPFKLIQSETLSHFYQVDSDSVLALSNELKTLGIVFLGRGNNKAIYGLPDNDSIVLALPFKSINLKTFRSTFASNLIMESLSKHVPHMYGRSILNSNGEVIGFYKQRVIGFSDPITQRFIGDQLRKVNKILESGQDPLLVDLELKEYLSVWALFNASDKYKLAIIMDDRVELQWMLREDGVPFYVDEFWNYYDSKDINKYLSKPDIDKILQDIKNGPNTKENFAKFLLGWQILFSLRD
jgi:hypothetical protein